MVNGGAQPDRRDPVVIGKFAYRMRKVRRALLVAVIAFCLLLVASIVAITYMSELARVVTLFSSFTVAVIVFLVTIPLINASYICPACGEMPIVPRYEGGIELEIAECEKCGAALK